MAFDVPVLPSLQEAIDAMPAADHLTFLVTAQGRPFTAAGFGNWFRHAKRSLTTKPAARRSRSNG